MKKCSKNGCVKDEALFYKQKRAKDGLDPYCIDCRNTVTKEWVAENRERQNELQRAWYQKNKDRLNAARRIKK